MKKETFSIAINAAPEKVWKILWEDKTYRIWTTPFTTGSHAVSDWKLGSKILFLDGKGNGMVSSIKAMDPPSWMSFEHWGEVKNGVEDIDSDNVKQWAGATENYRLTEINGGTMLQVEMEIAVDFLDYMLKTWPLALNEIKKLAEAEN